MHGQGRKLRSSGSLFRRLIHSSHSSPCLVSVDPGACSGVAVVTISAVPKLLFYREIRSSRKMDPLPSSVIQEIAEQYHPSEAVIEDQYLDKNVDSMKKLAWSVGGWQLACRISGIPFSMLFAKCWQTATFGKKTRTRAELKTASMSLSRAETKQNLSVDVSDAYCMGRYRAIERHFSSR